MRAKILMTILTSSLAGLLFLPTNVIQAKPQSQAKLSKASKKCLMCHKNPKNKAYKTTGKQYEAWKQAKHAEANVGCAECHTAQTGDPAAVKHKGRTVIKLAPSSAKCAECHDQPAEYTGKKVHNISPAAGK